MRFLFINGPNVNITRFTEPGVEGEVDYNGLLDYLDVCCQQMGIEPDFFQSNHEGDIVDKIAEYADDGIKGAIINPGAFTHTSVALRDSIAGSGIKFVEVHISNIYKREEFRHTSITAPVCEAQISGLGLDGYFAALRHLAALK